MGGSPTRKAARDIKKPRLLRLLMLPTASAEDVLEGGRRRVGTYRIYMELVK